jgi:PKD repeat protein
MKNTLYKTVHLLLLLLFISHLTAGVVKAQDNIAPLATITAHGTGATGCQSNPCSFLNNLNFGNCGTQLVWINTANLPTSPQNPGQDWIEWEFPNQVRFDAIVIHHANNAGARFLNGGYIQSFDGTDWVTEHIFQNLPLACSNRVEFDPIQAERFRITAFASDPVGQMSNPNFREIEIIEAPGGCAVVESPAPFPIADFLVSDTVFVNSPVNILSNTPINSPQYDQWYVNGQLVDSAENNEIRGFEHTFSPVGLHEVMLIVENCDRSQRDTLIKYIRVVNPTTPPTANFVSDKNKIVRGGQVQYTDLSSFGPTSWNWEVDPPTRTVFGQAFPSVNFVEGTNSSTRNPVMRFLWPGTYSITLNASNSIGTGSETKVEYIHVGYTMCPDEAPDFTATDEPAGILFDDGGDEEYGNNANCAFLIDPCVDALYISFEEFDMGCGSERLRIYDGTDNNAPPLHPGDGFTGAGCSDAALPPDTLKVPGGRAYIEWESGVNTDDRFGFMMRWYSDEKSDAPLADFNYPDTICVGLEVTFENTTTGGGLESYEWNFDAANTNTVMSTDEHGSYIFPAEGSYVVQLIAEDCGGLRDTVEHTVTVVDLENLHTVSFESNNLVPQQTHEVVTFTSKVTGGCNDIYEWEFSPSVVQYVNGTDSSSRHPEVRFHGTGCIDVTLHVTNTLGTVSEHRPCYIDVFAYCQPNVTPPLNADLGISRVRLEGIDHRTASAAEAYSDYTDSGYVAYLEAGQSYTLRMERPSNFNPVTRGAWIDFNQDGNFNDATEMVAFESSSNSTVFETTISIPGDALPGETRIRLASNLAGQPMLSCGPHEYGEFIDYRVLITPDVTAPEITLDGMDTVYLEVFDIYVEPGYSAWDDADGDLTNSVTVSSSLNNEVLGTYEINYSVSDQAGNVATETRVVIVEDTEDPEIVLNGPDSVYVEVNTSFDDPGVTITDNYWTSLSADLNTNLDITQLGVYEVEYCATDGSGNGPVCVKRTVTVGDTTAPVINFVFGDTVTLEVYDDLIIENVVTITDNYWPNHQLQIDQSDAENFVADDLGYFSLDFSATDGSGNEANATLVVEVLDRTAPIISLIGNEIVNIDQWVEYDDPGVIVSDNFDGSPEIIYGGSFQNTESAGAYYRSYQAVDQSGNRSQVLNRIINVRASSPPTSLNEMNDDEFSLKAYPNPATDVLTVQLNSSSTFEGKLTLVNMLGKEVMEIYSGKIESGEYQVGLEDLSPGQYMLRLESNNKHLVKHINVIR